MRRKKTEMKTNTHTQQSKQQQFLVTKVMVKSADNRKTRKENIFHAFLKDNRQIKYIFRISLSSVFTTHTKSIQSCWICNSNWNLYCQHTNSCTPRSPFFMTIFNHFYLNRLLNKRPFQFLCYFFYSWLTLYCLLHFVLQRF